MKTNPWTSRCHPGIPNGGSNMDTSQGGKLIPERFQKDILNDLADIPRTYEKKRPIDTITISGTCKPSPFMPQIPPIYAEDSCHRCKHLGKKKIGTMKTSHGPSRDKMETRSVDVGFYVCQKANGLVVGEYEGSRDTSFPVATEEDCLETLEVKKSDFDFDSKSWAKTACTGIEFDSTFVNFLNKFGQQRRTLDPLKDNPIDCIAEILDKKLWTNVDFECERFPFGANRMHVSFKCSDGFSNHFIVDDKTAAMIQNKLQRS
jgi:hypothetical protein